MASEKDQQENIIGKFGVGFYSVFMVADEVVITSRSFQKSAKAVEWKSKGVTNFEIKEIGGKVNRGTKIEIHLKEDAKDFLEKYKLESAVTKHSNFVPFPIKIEKDQVNKVRALWREPKFQLKDKDYEEFYKFLTYDNEKQLDTLHISVDAPVQFNALMFIPTKSFDMFGMGKDEHGLDLYVKRVLIQHENKDLLPEYLRFIRGVIDSEDVPLNISRETLQENLVISKIKNNLVSQILSHLQKMAKENEKKYFEFWKEFSKYFKMGYNDYSNREKFAELLRFNSSNDENADGLTSLAQYADRLKENQKEIYYLTLPSRDAVDSNPYLEIFRKKGLEVFYLYEPVDEFVMDALGKYKDFDLKSVEHADLEKMNEMTDVEEAKKAKGLSKEDEKTFDQLLRRIKDILGDRVTDVVESKRLTDSPSCLVSPDGKMTSSMQKIMNLMNKDVTPPKKSMEINKDHELIRNLLKIYKNNTKDKYLEQIAEQLYESALLLEGYLTDPHKMVNRIQDILEKSTDWYLKK
jgi:molecular chaperone HtpG